MTEAALALACVDTVAGALALWLIWHLWKGQPMKHIRDRREEHDWRERRGRFKDCDPDTPDRPQVMPVPRPLDSLNETHGFGPLRAEGRLDQAERGKPWGPDDDS